MENTMNEERIAELERRIADLENRDYPDDDDDGDWEDGDDEDKTKKETVIPNWSSIFPRIEQPNIAFGLDDSAYVFGAFPGGDIELSKRKNPFFPFGERKPLSTEEQVEVKTIMEKLKTIINGKSWEKQQ